MPSFTLTYICLGAAGLAVLAGVGLLSRARNPIQTARKAKAGIAAVAVGVLLFLAAAWYTFRAAQYSYELGDCEDWMSFGDNTTYSNLSATGQDIFRSTLEADGSYYSVQSAPDFEYVTDAIMRTPIEYQGECYAMLAHDAGLGWGIMIVGPIFLLGIVVTTIGLLRIRSGDWSLRLVWLVLLGLVVAWVTLHSPWPLLGGVVATLLIGLWLWLRPIERLR